MMSYAQWGNALYSGEKSYKIIPHRKIFVWVAAIMIVVCIAIIAFFGFNRSIEFTGGSQFTMIGVSKTGQQPAYDALAKNGVGDVKVSNLGSNGIRIQTPSLDTDKTAKVRDSLAKAYGVKQTDVQSSSIGPSWGKDVTNKALQSLVIFLVLVTVMMTIYFRSWTMSLSALFALLHDVFVTVGFFAITRFEVSPATVIGFLTILGYSIYDNVVVFDKIRELSKNVWKQSRYTYGEIVNLAVNQTMVRSLNTSVVALLPVLSILVIGSFLLGAGTLTDISLSLFVGMLVGTYSSICVASPLLVILEERLPRTKEHTQRVLEQRSAQNGETEDGEKGTSGNNHPVSQVTTPVKPGRRLDNDMQPRRKKRKHL